MNNDTPDQFETVYRTSWKNIALLLGIGLLLGAFMAYEAMTNTSRLSIGGLIELSVGQATVFFWLLAAAMFALVILAILALFQRLRGNNRLVITSEGISLPGPVWSPEQRFYPFSSFEWIKVASVYGSHILQVKTTRGRFTVARQNLPSLDAFAEIVVRVAERAGH